MAILLLIFTFFIISKGIVDVPLNTHRRQLTIEEKITPLGHQVAFTVTAYFGSQRQPLQMLVDTGSSVLDELTNKNSGHG